MNPMVNFVKHMFFLIIFAFGFNNSIKADIKTDSTLQKNSIEDKIFSLSNVWAEIKYNYPGVCYLDFDADSLYNSMINKVINSNNDIEFYDLLQEFMSRFNDGHTELIERSYNWGDYFDYIPVLIEEFDCEYYFTMINKNSGLDSTYLGAKILKIFDRDIDLYLEDNIFKYLSYSTKTDRCNKAASLLQQGFINNIFKARVVKINGDVCDVELKYNGEISKTDHDEFWGIRDVLDYPIKLKFDNNIAILKINRLYPNKMVGLIDSCMHEVHKKAKGLILDLRNNKGGDTDIAEHLQMYLCDSSFLSTGSRVRINDGYYKSQGNYMDEYRAFYKNTSCRIIYPDTIYRDDNITALSIPVVILIGKKTYSACEDLLVGLYEHSNRPLLIGETTAGTTGSPLVISLPNNAKARICTVQVLYPYSLKPFRNSGIQPDIVIKNKIIDRLNGTDRVMDESLKVIKNIINERRCDKNEEN